MQTRTRTRKHAHAHAAVLHPFEQRVHHNSRETKWVASTLCEAAVAVCESTRPAGDPGAPQDHLFSTFFRRYLASYLSMRWRRRIIYSTPVHSANHHRCRVLELSGICLALPRSRSLTELVPCSGRKGARGVLSLM